MASSSPSFEKTELAHLDGLRAVAALYVAVHHCLLQVNFTESHLFGVAQKIAAVFGYGHYAVDLFLVLSGFCLAIPFARADFARSVPAGAFFLKRARRILPPYFATCVVSLLITFLWVGPEPLSQWSKTLVQHPRDIVTHLFLVQDVFVDTANKINYVLWSISIEWRIYFLFPLLLLAWRRWGGASAVALAAAATAGLAASIQALHPHYSNLNLGPCGICPHFLMLFVFGIFAAEIALSETPLARRCRALPWTFLLAVTSLLIPLAPKLKLLLGRQIPWEFNDLCVGLATLCLLVVCGAPAGTARAGDLARLFAWRPLAFVGTFAYSIYLIHAPIVELLWRYAIHRFALSPGCAAVAITLLGLPLILPASYLFYRLFERPFTSRASRNRSPVAEPLPLSPQLPQIPS